MNRFGVPELSPTEVKARLDKKDGVMLLDIREHDEVAMASIEGAVHIPMRELGARLKEVPQEKDVIVFCHHGSRSLMVAAQLKRRGYTHVMHMGGGIDQWSQQVDGSVPQYE
jgi:rhodanese-related sulfurtransferase